MGNETRTVGIVGLGRMGHGLGARLIAAGHEVVGFDLDPAAVEELVARGGIGATGLEDLVGRLGARRIVWLMLPAGKVVDRVIGELEPFLSPDDVVIDGGNSYYKDSLRRAEALAGRDVRYLDVGVSGGVWGEEKGFCLMIGGPEEAVRHLRPVFRSLAPAADRGWAHVGPSGAGHYVKMVHNGIEYALMQAYAEGFSLLEKKDELELDPARIGELWRHGSVIRSWLLDLAARALADDPALDKLEPWVDDSGHGRWTVAESLELACPTPVIAQSLYQRFSSRGESDFADKLLAALRQQFGGHAVRPRE